MSRHLQLLDFWGCSPEKVPNQQEQRVERSQVPHPLPAAAGKGWALMTQRHQLSSLLFFSFLFFRCHPDRSGRLFLPRRSWARRPRSAHFASRVVHRDGGTVATSLPFHIPL